MNKVRDLCFLNKIKSLLVACGLECPLPDESVDPGHVDVVQLLDGRLDLVLVRLEVDQEDQGVVVFDLLHRRLSGQGMLDDVVSVHSKIGKDGSLGKV